MRHRTVVLIAAVVLAAAAAAAWQVRGVLTEARGETSILFNQGLAPVTTAAPTGWTNQWCGSCHKQAFAEWEQSRHKVAGTNHNFQVECLVKGSGRQQYCMNCHTPRIPGGLRLPTEEPPGLDDAYRHKPDWLVDGVDCLTCHVRDGQVVTTTAAKVTNKGLAAHPMRADQLLGQAEFCAGCHQFAFKDDDLPDRFHGALQQASLEEFLEYRELGGIETRCQDCHMQKSRGRHLMPGGYDDKMVRRAVDLDVQARWIEPGKLALLTVTLKTGSVGHRVPGGEELRFLTVRTAVLDANGEFFGQRVSPAGSAGAGESAGEGVTESPLARWPVVEELRRYMGVREHGKDQRAPAEPDTRLVPGETRRYSYRVRFDPFATKGPLTIRTRLWYHLMNDDKAQLFGHKTRDVQRVVRQVEVALPDAGSVPRPK